MRLMSTSAVRTVGSPDVVLHMPTSKTPTRNAVSSPELESKNWFAVAGAQLVFVMSLALLIFGFYQRDSDFFVPGEGLGYKLGIAGGASMLLLLFYPLVKRSTRLGYQKHSVFWLRLHMVLGTVGPLLIFYHSNFSLGATNSNIALFSMILVAASGVLGKYIYTRVYRGMSSVKLDLGSFLANSARLITLIGDDAGGNSAQISKVMAEFAKSALPQRSGVLISFANVLVLSTKTSQARSRIMREVRKTLRVNANAANWNRAEEIRRFEVVRKDVNEFLYFVGKSVQFTFWERMFSLWHVFHVPLFFVLFVSGVIHVIAVHVY